MCCNRKKIPTIFFFFGLLQGLYFYGTEVGFLLRSRFPIVSCKLPFQALFCFADSIVPVFRQRQCS